MLLFTSYSLEGLVAEKEGGKALISAWGRTSQEPELSVEAGHRRERLTCVPDRRGTGIRPGRLAAV